MANPFALSEIQASDSGVRASLIGAMDSNPDQAATAARLARAQGVPASAVEANLPEVEKQAKIDYYAEMLKGSPATQEFMRDPEKAKIAHDDVENLHGVETTLNSLGRFTLGSGKAIVSGAFLRANEGLYGAAQSFYESMPFGLGDSFAKQTAAVRKDFKWASNEIMPKAEGIVERSWYSGMQSLGLMAAMLPVAIASGGTATPVVAGMGLTTGGSAYGDARDKGKSVGRSLVYGGVQGGIEAGTEMIGMPALFSILKPGKFLTKAAEYMVKEQGGEQLATHLQDLNEWATLNPEKTMGDYLKERPNAAIETALATAFGGGGQVVLMKGVEVIANRNSTRVQNADVTRDTLGKISELVAANKVLARDASTFEALVADVAERGNAPAAVFIDANTLQQSGIVEQLAQVSPAVAEQYQSALQSGGNVQIPIEEYTARIAPTEFAQSLVDHIKFDADEFSKAEAAEYMQNEAPALQAEVERVMAEQEADDMWKQSAQEVEDAVFNELQTAGRFTEQVNRTNAVLHKAFAATRAANLGITPMEFFKQHTLRVIADRVGGDQFDQGGKLVTDTPQFKNWFGESKVVDAQGAPLVVYHGTNADFSEFKTTRGGEFGPAIYFTDSPREAGEYGEVAKGISFATPSAHVMPSFVRLNNPYTNGVDEFWKEFGAAGSDAAGVEMAKAAGYDGIIAKRPDRYYDNDAHEWVDRGNTLTHYVVFDPKQIKSAIGNNGNFDPNDANILHQQSLDDLLAQFDNADTISIEANAKTEQDIDDEEQLFLSAFPAATTTYRRKTGILARIRRSSDKAADELGNDPEATRRVTSALGHFTGYSVTADSVAPDEFYNPNGALKVKVFGKEQVEAGLIEEPALTFTVMQDGELSVNGPSPDGATFKEFKARGWAEQAKAGDQIAQGWTALTTPEGGNLPLTQLVPLLADVHARVRLWKIDELTGEPVTHTGLHWARATGALAAFGDYGTAVFFQNNGGNRGSFTPTTNTIALLKNADLSTFLHESAHFFLEVQADLANRLQQKTEALTTGERQILDDTNALLNWFGISTLGEWNNLDFEEKRGYHEQFARGFEAYLYEGKAPSIELHGAFQRFRAWLLNVYKSLKQLNVELTDEVRGVFDRMLATTEQIQLAEQARSMLPLFETAEAAGMAPDDFAKYQSLGVDSTNTAIEELQARGLRDMQWLHNARGREVKKLQKESDAKRAEIRMEVKTEIMSQPVYRAWEYLTGKDTDAPESILTEADGTRWSAHGRIDRASLDEMDLPIEITDRLDKLRMVKRDALHPDVVAELITDEDGKPLFTSGDELVRKLAAADKPNDAIEGLTDQRMLERYGDLSSEAAIERAADAAIHNDVRARMVATEANALAKATGQKKLLIPAAKAFASATIARLKVRNIRPSQYANAEARAGKAAAKARKAGDIATASAEKRNQLLQICATRAAYDALADVDKALRYLKRFDGDVKLDPEYFAQIDALLSRFDLRKGQSLKAIDKRAALAEWVKSQQDQGLEPSIPDDLLNEAFRKSYKDMTVEEFRGLVDTIKQIEHLGRLKHKLLTAKNQRAYEAVRDEIVASIEEHAKDREADTRTPTTSLGRVAQGLKRFWASHIKAAIWARVMDGGKDGGPMWEYFVRVANERGDYETTERAKATEALSKIMAPVFAFGKMGGKGVFFPSIQRSLNRESRIAIALNVGNEGNLQRLLGGEGWTLQQLAPVLQSITPEEWRVVQAVWDHFETYHDAIDAKEKRVYGKGLNWVVPGTQITTDIGLNGGYYPIKYDPAASQRAEEHADAEDSRRQLQGAYTTATTRRSFTKTRASEVSGRPLLYTLAGLYSGVNDVIHDLAWHEWLIDTNRLLRSKSIDSAIRNIYGPEVKQQFKTWSQDIAEGDRGTGEALDMVLGRLRQGVSVSGLGFNVMSAAIQPLGITQSIVRVGAPWIARGVTKYVAHPVAASKEANEKSSFMENRSRTRFRELNELRNRVQDQSPFKEAVGKYAYLLMMRCQQMVDVPTWHGAYEKAIAEGNDEERSIGLADQAVIDSQGGGQTKDLSAIERGGPAQKLFTVFYSFMNTALNLGVGQTMTADKKAKLMSDMLMLYVIPPVLGLALKAAITPGDSGDDDMEKIAKKLAANQLDYLMGLMVVAREFSDGAKTLFGVNDFGRDYSGPAGLRMITDFGKASGQIAQGEFDMALFKSSVNLVGDLLGLPSAQINRTVTGAKALIEGETTNPAALAFGFQKPR